MLDEEIGIGGRGDGGADVVGGPDVVFAFSAFGVGIEGGVEGAVGIAHFPEPKVEGLAGDAGVVGASELDGGEGVCGGELGIVVEHFFEVWDEPEFVGGVACESACDMVVDAAAHHGVEGFGGHVAEGGGVGWRELRGVGVAEHSEPEVEGLVGGNLGAEPRPPWVSSKRSMNCSMTVAKGGW